MFALLKCMRLETHSEEKSSADSVLDYPGANVHVKDASTAAHTPDTHKSWRAL